MFNWVLGQVIAAKDRQRIAIALGKGGAMMHARSIDLRNPASWEFSGFSQNGEDGILDVLRKQLKSSNRYFAELLPRRMALRTIRRGCWLPRSTTAS